MYFGLNAFATVPIVVQFAVFAEAEPLAWNDRFGYYSVNLVRRRNDTQVVPYNVIRIVALW